MNTDRECIPAGHVSLSFRPNRLLPALVRYFILCLVTLTGFPVVSMISGSGKVVGTAAAQDEGQVDPEAEDRSRRLQRLQLMYDQETDPVQKIKYLRRMKLIFSPYYDLEKILALEEQIKALEKEVEHLSEEKKRENAIKRVHGIIATQGLGVAEQEAEQLVERYPEDPEVKDLRRQVKTRRLVEEAKATLLNSEATSGELKAAKEKAAEALTLSPEHSVAQNIKLEIEARLRRTRTQFWTLIALLVLLLAGAGAGVWIWLRPRKWVLEAIYGPCKGEVFPLEKEEVVIGALGPPDGEADIVISDAERKISRTHCSIVQERRRLYVVDGSSNGTMVNEKRIEKESYVRVRSGDEISLADEAVLLLRAERSPASAAPAKE